MMDYMIDIETLGLEPNAAVLSIGACSFDLYAKQIYDKLEINIELESALKGRSITASTLTWWLEQSSEAQKVFMPYNKRVDVKTALILLTAFIPGQSTVWANGATFDIVILEDLYRQYELPIPWKFYNINDVRTIVRLAENFVYKTDVPFEGTQHNALADAVHQALYVSEMWCAIRNALKED